jgi:hypothetical protein
MKYLKTFENFDLGRFSENDENEMDKLSNEDEIKQYQKDEDKISCSECGCDDCNCGGNEEEEKDVNDEDESKKWGDQVVVERKKVNAGFQAYLDKKEKAGKKEDKKEEKGGKKAKPDFLDLDKDGNKKESMKKAAKDAKSKEVKKDDKKDEPKFGSPEWQKKHSKKK